MEGNTSKSRVLLVFGAPCSGKTTFAKKMSERFHIVYYNLNDIMSELGLKHKELIGVLELISRTGRTLILEGGLDTEKERNAIRRVFKKAGYDASLIWIQTDTATIRARMKAKYQAIAKAKEEYETNISRLEAPVQAESPIILSGKHTFETQAKLVLAGLADADKR